MAIIRHPLLVAAPRRGIIERLRDYMMGRS